MTVGIPPVMPPLARVGGFKSIGQTVLDGGDERAASVDTSEVVGLTLHEHPMKRQNLVVALDTYRLHIHRSSLPDGLHRQLGRCLASLRWTDWSTC